MYIIGGQFPDVFAGDEDPVPADGNPHPLHDHVLHVNPDVPQNLMHDLVGAGAEVQTDFGVQPQQMNEIVEEMLAANKDDVENDLQGENLNDQVNGQPNQGQDQQHDQQQVSITFDQSGSTAQYLRAQGPDIHLTVEMVLQGQLGSSSNASSSDFESSITSVQNVDTVMDVPMFQFGQTCTMLLPVVAVSLAAIYIPLPLSLKRKWNVAFNPPLQINSGIPNGSEMSKAIIPYRPSLHAVLIQLWASKVDSLDNASPHGPMADSELLDENLDVPGVDSQQMQLDEAADDSINAKKCLLSAFKSAATSSQIPIAGLPPKPPKKMMQLPASLSSAVEGRPMVVSQVRRSPRLSKGKEGYKHCRLEDMPKKKRRNTAKGPGSEVLAPLPSVKEGLMPEDVQGPIPMETLQEWGVECGASPREVTDALLLKERSSTVSK